MYKYLIGRSLATALALVMAGNASAGLITFDNLSTPPAVTSAGGLFFANSDSAVYGGVIWDSRATVFGDAYRVDPGSIPPGPLFGRPTSGHYGLTNTGDALNDGLLLTTNLVLTSAWFGRNEYYGFGAGADQITINALNGSNVLASVTFDLPELLAGEPEMLSKVDTGAFLALSGITGYRIDRRELGQQSGNWVADDFDFVAARTVVEPSSAALVLGALLALVGARRRRTAV